MLKNFWNKVFNWALSLKKIFFGEGSIFYIGGSENLPEPLSDEEEKQMIFLFEKENDLSAKSKLIEHNLRLVAYIARRFENTNINLEDLISIGTIGLIKAINTFHSEKNIKLATYASRCIENEILMYLRRNNKTQNEISIYESLNTDGSGNELLLADILGTDNDMIFSRFEEETDKKVLNYAIVNKLNKREKQIVYLRYGINSENGEELTQKEVADKLGISQSYISRLEKRIIMRLKNEIKKMA